MAEAHAGAKHESHKKAKKPEEGLKVDAPLWMMSWADMVTLLMALFVAMYSLSTLDTVKFQKFLEGIHGIKLTSEKTPSALEQINEGLTFPLNPAHEEAPRGEGKQPGDTPNPAIEPGIHRRTDREITGQPALGVPVLFQAGSATLGTEGKKSLHKFAAEVRGYASKIEIRGHCSQGESEIPRNLSYARCMAVYDYLTGYDAIDDHRLKITAMGTAEPVNADQSEFEKKANRWVHVTETPEYSKEAPPPR